AVITYMTELGSSIAATGKYSSVQKDLLAKTDALLQSAYKKLGKLEAETKKAQGIDKVEKQAIAFRDKVLPELAGLRTEIDALETIMPHDLWPVPTYSDLLFKL
ncbi:MAG: glutamine synthetase type III, partial [Desulfobulbaceae bacterium]|nr:glutamine synthetase type III [Desulfobulbaceae bacterium]